MNDSLNLSELINDLMTSKDFAVRIKAALQLAETKQPTVLEPLLSALSDRDEDVRCEVIKALSILGDASVAPRIVTFLMDTDPKVRVAAIKAIFKLGAIQHIPEIYLRLDDPDWSVRNWTIKILNQFINQILKQDADTGGALIIGMLRSKEPTLRHKVEASLIEANTKYFSQLLKVLEKGEAAQIISVCYILSKINNRDAVFHLLNIINHRDKYVRIAVIRALGEIKDIQSISTLIRRLGDANVQVRREAVKTLTKFKKDSVLPLIRALVMNRDSYIRANSAIALGEIRDEKAVSALIASLSDSYFLVRDSVSKALIKFGPSIYERLINIVTPVFYNLELAYQLLDSPRADERLKGIDILSDISDPRSVKVLQKMLMDPYPKVQEKAQEVLSKLGCNAWARTGAVHILGTLRVKKAEKTLIKSLDDPDKDVRIESIRSLGLIRSKEAVPQLITKLHDNFADIRTVTAWTLGRIGSVDALFPLIESLKDPDSEVRFNAIAALGKLLDPQAVIPLLNLINLSTYRQKEAAVNAIKTIGKRAVPIILKSIEEKNQSIIDATKEVLIMMKDDFNDNMINEIISNLTENQKKYFLKIIGK